MKIISSNESENIIQEVLNVGTTIIEPKISIAKWEFLSEFLHILWHFFHSC